MWDVDLFGALLQYTPDAAPQRNATTHDTVRHRTSTSVVTHANVLLNSMRKMAEKTIRAIRLLWAKTVTKLSEMTLLDTRRFQMLPWSGWVPSVCCKIYDWMPTDFIDIFERRLSSWMTVDTDWTACGTTKYKLFLKFCIHVCDTRFHWLFGGVARCGTL